MQKSMSLQYEPSRVDPPESGRLLSRPAHGKWSDAFAGCIDYWSFAGFGGAGNVRV